MNYIQLINSLQGLLDIPLPGFVGGHYHGYHPVLDNADIHLSENSGYLGEDTRLVCGHEAGIIICLNLGKGNQFDIIDVG